MTWKEWGGKRPGDTVEISCCGREAEERDTLIGREGTLLPDRQTTKTHTHTHTNTASLEGRNQQRDRERRFEVPRCGLSKVLEHYPSLARSHPPV